MRVTVLDYGAGNLHSVTRALAVDGIEVRCEADPLRALETDALVLPGVGAFAPAAARLAPARGEMRRAIVDGLPTLGICLGMQLLFEASDEGDGEGLGVLAGRVGRLRARRRPQVGWNAIDGATDPLFSASGLRVGYYANSFVCRPFDASSVCAWSTHESDTFAAAVRRGSCVGVQFHPEKSSLPGIRFLRAWLLEAAAVRGVTSPGVLR
jgi:glutamine amidotransferase